VGASPQRKKKKRENRLLGLQESSKMFFWPKIYPFKSRDFTVIPQAQGILVSAHSQLVETLAIFYCNQCSQFHPNALFA